MRSPRSAVASASAAAVVTLPIVVAGVGAEADPTTGGGEPGPTQPRQERDLAISVPAPSPLEQQVAYWHRKAVKRLGGWHRANLRIRRLKRRLDGSSSTAPRLSVPHLSDWLCIHRYEGAWNDGGDPYWGGLQMDRQFMSTYAPRWLLAKGWANSWSPREQMWVAERAWRVRGFAPWPNTAAICGLL